MKFDGLTSTVKLENKQHTVTRTEFDKEQSCCSYSLDGIPFTRIKQAGTIKPRGRALLFKAGKKQYIAESLNPETKHDYFCLIVRSLIVNDILSNPF